MPTHTPSPHRFLAPGHASTQKAKLKPHSSLRNVLAVQTPPATRDKPELPLKTSTPAKRFVIAPHRRTQSAEEHSSANVDESSRHQRPQAEPTPRPTPRPKPVRKFERVESIEELSQSSPTRPPDDDNGFGIVESIEQRMVGNEQEEEEDDDDEILFVTEQRHKRRRISPPTSPPSHPLSSPSSRQPSSPTSHNPPTTHRFLVPPPRTPVPFTTTHANPLTDHQTPTTTPAPAHHRPSFILPALPSSPLKPTKPLPEIFSPSRKTQKYVPDGLASTLQSWIIEAANTGDAVRERGVVWGREREDGVKMRIRVKACGVEDGDMLREIECRPGHVVFVRGVSDPTMYSASRASSVAGDDGETKILLAGQGGARGAGGVKIKIGASVGIKQPMWDVDVGGEMWTVGVDWVVL